jgi:molybdenum cofactor cytidylyltransferase
MKFGPLPVAQAEGAILAHGIAVSGQSWKKGRHLSAADIAALQANGCLSVVAGRLEADDVPEDEAARRLAEVLCGSGATLTAAFTGRANLYAAAPGLAMIDAARIEAINTVDEAITVATLAPGDMVEARQMLATVKIIPFAVPRAVLDRALAAAVGTPAIGSAPFRPQTTGLIMTRLPATKASVLEKTHKAVADRLEQLGGRIASAVTTGHDEQALAATLREMAAGQPDSILVFGASAIVDTLDVVPAAIRAAGGTVLRFGMPVDPGNLILIGALAGRPVIGVPGCARSPKVNGFDFVLRRLAAGLPVDGPAIARMGVGGLLKEIEIRPQPRDIAPLVARAPRLAAIVLAAGRSSRMAGPNKLTQPLRGKALVLHGVDAAVEAGCECVVVVTGHDREAVAQLVADRPVAIVHNPQFADGLSTSLRAGLDALDEAIDGAFILLGDMPRIRAQDLSRLAAGFAPDEGRAILVPTAGGEWGNPILWARRFFPAMRELSGDRGARMLAVANQEFVTEVAMPGDGVLIDLDTAAAFAAEKGA